MNRYLRVLGLGLVVVAAGGVCMEFNLNKIGVTLISIGIGMVALGPFAISLFGER